MLISMNIQECSHHVLSSLGMRIAHIRGEKGLTQEQLAQRTMMDRAYIAGVETGVRNLTFDSMLRIADGLDVSMAFLCKDVDRGIVAERIVR